MRFEQFNEDGAEPAEIGAEGASIERGTFNMSEAIRSEAIALGKFSGEAGRFARALMLVSALSAVPAERIEGQDGPEDEDAWSSLENSNKLLKNL